METIIDNALNKKFTEFSNTVKAELHSKLNGTDIIKAYSKEINTIAEYKDKFSKINTNDNASGET